MLSRLVVAGLSLTTLAQAQSYQLTDLGTLLPSRWSESRAINSSGLVVGQSLGSPGPHAFVHGCGRMYDIHTIGVISAASDINDDGIIVGSTLTNSNKTVPFVHDGVVMRLLPTLGTGEGAAWGINSNGWIAGSFRDSTHSMRAFLYDGQQMRDLGSLGGSVSLAYAVNDLGEVVGGTTTLSNSRAFLYRNHAMIDLGTLPGSLNSIAYDLNERGQVVGKTSDTASPDRGFMWEGGQMQEIFPLPNDNRCMPAAINNHGVIVGSSLFGSTSQRAFVYENGVIHALNDLIESGNDWDLKAALDINDHGQITAVGTQGTQVHAIRLDPIHSNRFRLERPVPGVASTRNRLQAKGSEPGQRILFFYGMQSGKSPVPGCPYTCLDLIPPMELLAIKFSDARGQARVIQRVPARALGKSYYFQALDFDGCVVTNRVLQVFQ